MKATCTRATLVPDGTGFGTHFRVRIECDAFANLNAVARHRRIYTCLQAFFDYWLARLGD